MSKKTLFLAVILAITAVTLVAMAGEKPDRKVVKKFSALYASEEPGKRIEAINLLSDEPHVWVAKTLTGILHKEKDESVVDAGVEMIRLHKCPEIGKILISATGKAQRIKPHYPAKPKGGVSPTPTMPQAVDIGTRLRLGYLGILNEMDKVEGIKNLISVLQSEENFDVIQVAFDVLKKNRDQLDVDDLVKMGKKTRKMRPPKEMESYMGKLNVGVELRVELMKIIWEYDSRKGFDFVVDCLSDQAWQVRQTAINLLADAYEQKGAELCREAIRTLIGLLEKEPDDRVKKHLKITLWELTGRAFGDDIQKWKDWWAQHGEAYAGPPQEKEDKRPDSDDMGTELEEVKEKKPSFFGTEIKKKRVAFVIDISGSMTEASTGGTKMDVVKRELKKTIGSFTKHYKFNMFFYNTTVRSWKEALVKALDDIKEEALIEVDKLAAAGMTNISGALKKAAEDADCQTIFLLSDGKPTAGITDVDALLRDVRSWNKYKNITINTIGMQGCDPEFMRKLAEQNGGSFVNAN